MIEILILSSVVGVVGTGLGGAVGLLVGRKSAGTVSYLLSFSAGVILSISVFDLIPEALEMSGTLLVSLALLGGVGCVGLLHLAAGRAGEKIRRAPAQPCRTGTRGMRTDTTARAMRTGPPAAFRPAHAVRRRAAQPARRHRHRLRHGAQRRDRLILAVLIAMHNIPEGIGIGVPLRAGGMRRRRSYCSPRSPASPPCSAASSASGWAASARLS